MSPVSVSTYHDVVTIGNDQIALTYNVPKAKFTIHRHGNVPPLLSDAIIGVECEIKARRRALYGSDLGPNTWQQSRISDLHGTGWELTIDHAAKIEGLALTLTIHAYEKRPFLLLRLSVHNRSGHPMRLHRLYPIQVAPPHGRVQFGENAAPLHFLKVGWHAWPYTGLRHTWQKDIRTRLGPLVRPVHLNPTTPISHRQGEFRGEGWGILTDQKTAIVAGLVSQADQFAQIHVRCSPKQSALTVIAQADGVELPPRESIHSEWVLVQFVDLPHADPAAEYVQAVARQMTARVPDTPPQPGWCSWYQYFDRVQESDMLSNLGKMDDLAPTLPMELVQLDDGYQTAWGDWDTCNDKFPRGLAPLAADITASGRQPGLWLAPFLLSPHSQLARDHPDWLLRNARGRPVSSGFLWKFFGRALDATHPGVQEWLHTLFQKIVNEWGFRYLKLDFLYAAALPGRRHDPTLTRAQALRRGLQIIREAVGDDVFLLGCGCPFGPAIGMVDGMRIGPDVAPRWEPDAFNLPLVRWLIRNEMAMPAARNNVRHTLNLSALHRRWWWNDPDCLLARDTDTHLTAAQVRSLISVMGLSGGMLVDSDNLAHLSPQRQQWAAAIWPILSEGARPLDLLEREMAERYDLPVSHPWASWHVVGAFNWSSRPARQTLDLARVGFDGQQPVHAFDFWQREHRLCREPTLDLGEIAPYDCRVLRLCTHQAVPTLVGSTLHITQGNEITRWVVSGNELRFTIRDLGRRVEGEIWLWLPGEDAHATSGDQEIATQAHGQGIFVLPLQISTPADIVVTWTAAASSQP